MNHHNNSSLITVVIDMDESGWTKVHRANLMGVVSSGMSSTNPASEVDSDKDPITLHGVLKAIMVFLNASLALNRENQVAMFAACSDGLTRCVASSNEDVGPKLVENIKRLGEISRQQTSTTVSGSGLALALSKALCYTQRVMLDHKAKFGVEPLSRILVIQVSDDDPSQYIAAMNAAFAAQKQQICVDVCDFSIDGSKMLQQVAHLSGGILQHYTKMTIGAFTEHLLSVFLSDPETRKYLKLPPQAPIILQAACFCHGQLKSRGWVCSVCLSVFCRDPTSKSGSCPTCHTRIVAPR